MAVVRLLPGGTEEDVILRKEAGLFAGLGIQLMASPLKRLKSNRALKARFEKAEEYRARWEEYREKLETFKKALARGKRTDKGEVKSPERAGQGKKGGSEKGEGEKTGAKEDRPSRGGGRKAFRASFGDEKGMEKPPSRSLEKKQEKKGTAPPKRPAEDPDLEVLVRVLAGKIPLFLEVHHASDILFALRLKERFALDLVLVGCTEGDRVAERIAEAGVPVVLGPVIRPHFRERNEFFHLRSDRLKTLIEKGVSLVLASSGRDPGESRFLSLYAALAVQAGCDRKTALRSVTLAPAQILGVGDRIGSLEKGKDADLVLYRGNPLESEAEVVKVFVKGCLVYDRE